MKQFLPSRDQVGTLLLALVLATIVWVVAVQQKNPLETRTVTRIPVSMRNLPEDLIAVDAAAPLLQADVRVRAPLSVWNILTSNDLRAYVDMESAVPGRQELPITIEPRLANVDVQEIIPGAAVVTLEKRLTKSIPVTVRVLDRPPFGYVAGSPAVVPATVQLTAAESVVNAVDRAEVTVRLSDARQDFTTRESVTLRDATGAILTGVTPEPRTVQVTVPISQQTGVSEKTVLPKLEGQPAANYRLTGVTAEPATITVVGSPDVLAEMPSYVETTPIDLEGATANIEERVPLVLPVNVTAATNQSVVVRIGIEPIEGSVTMTLKPVIQGLDPLVQLKGISPETIDAILQGPLPRLSTLTSQNVQATLDLSGIGAGVHTLIPQLLLPEGVTLKTLLPENVEVTVDLAPTPTATPTNAPTPAAPTPTPARR